MHEAHPAKQSRTQTPSAGDERRNLRDDRESLVGTIGDDLVPTGSGLAKCARRLMRGRVGASQGSFRAGRNLGAEEDAGLKPGATSTDKDGRDRSERREDDG